MLVYIYTPTKTVGVFWFGGVVQELWTSELDEMARLGVNPTDNMVRSECAWLPPGTPVD